MEKDNILFDEDRGRPNQRSNQTKSSKSTNLTKKEDTNNSISKIHDELSNYFAVNGFRLNKKREVVNPILNQIQNGLNVLAIPKHFFKHNRQIQNWIIRIPNKERESYLTLVLEEFSGIRLTNFKIMVV